MSDRTGAFRQTMARKDRPFVVLSDLVGFEASPLIEARKAVPAGSVCVWPTGTYEKQSNGRWKRVDDHTAPSKTCYPPKTPLAAIKADTPADEPLPPPDKTSPKFDEKDLKDSLTAVREGDDANAERKARSQLSRLMEEFGLHSWDRAVRSNYDALTVSEAEFGSAAHAWDGSILISPKTLKNSIRFLNGDWDDVSVAAMKTLVHEEVHGCSPLEAQSYVGAGAAFEEATTELAARKVMVKKWGPSPPVNSANMHFGVGTYKEEIRVVLKAIEEMYATFGIKKELDALVDAAADASIKLRAKTDKLLFEEDYVARFAKVFPIDKTAWVKAGHDAMSESMFRKGLAEHIQASLEKFVAKADTKYGYTVAP